MKTMTNQLFSDADFDKMRSEGYVRVNAHPDLPELFILNYTEKAAFEGVWNDVTLNCRGLIVDAFNWILARPFPKFFNYGQPGCPEVDLDSPATITDKMDGSLGILYRNPDTGKYAIATRGSFASDQAIHATEVFNRKYADYIVPKGITMLFEIVYPENRIVCDYGDMNDLVFLGSVEISTGDSWGPEQDWNWPGPVTEILPYRTMREALAADPRPGKEGVVVNDWIYGTRVKIKQEDYIALHRIVTGLNARSVWQAMVDDTVDELIEQIPDEFHDFIRGVEADINEQVDEAVLISNQTYDGILDVIGDNPSKKEFAMVAKKYSYSWALFNLFDNKDIRSKWLQIYKPKHDYSPVKVSNDAD